MICETSSIEMTTSSGGLRTIRTKNMIQKVKTRLKRKKSVIPKTGSGTRYFENKRSTYIEISSRTSALQEKDCSVDDRCSKVEKKKVLRIGSERISKKKTH